MAHRRIEYSSTDEGLAQLTRPIFGSWIPIVQALIVASTRPEAVWRTSPPPLHHRRPACDTRAFKMAGLGTWKEGKVKEKDIPRVPRQDVV